MKIYREGSLSSFEFWSGAIPNALEFTPEELDKITIALEALDGGDGAVRRGAEYCDVTIRCYLLGNAIAEAIDELETEGFFKEGYFEEE